MGCSKCIILFMTNSTLTQPATIFWLERNTTIKWCQGLDSGKTLSPNTNLLGIRKWIQGIVYNCVDIQSPSWYTARGETSRVGKQLWQLKYIKVLDFYPHQMHMSSLHQRHLLKRLEPSTQCIAGSDGRIGWRRNTHPIHAYLSKTWIESPQTTSGWLNKNLHMAQIP